jgi:engulfment/cell motility protein 1
VRDPEKPQENTINGMSTLRMKVALRQEHLRPWHEMVQDFTECEYRGVRDRQMKELEEEDDLLSKIPVRNLRSKLLKESKEFVRQQRIHCLMQGEWFLNAIPVSEPNPRRPARPWRFMRLVRVPPPPPHLRCASTVLTLHAG